MKTKYRGTLTRRPPLDGIIKVPGNLRQPGSGGGGGLIYHSNEISIPMPRSYDATQHIEHLGNDPFV